MFKFKGINSNKMLSKIKDILINQSIIFPIRTLILSLAFTMFIFFGVKYFYLEDDLIKTFPKNEAAIPKLIKTKENPNAKIIVLIKTIFLSLSISSSFLPVI